MYMHLTWAFLNSYHNYTKNKAGRIQNILYNAIGYFGHIAMRSSLLCSFYMLSWSFILQFSRFDGTLSNSCKTNFWSGCFDVIYLRPTLHYLRHWFLGPTRAASIRKKPIRYVLRYAQSNTQYVLTIRY